MGMDLPFPDFRSRKESENRQMFQYLVEKTTSETEEIRKTIQELFRQTCIMKIKYDPETVTQRINPRYSICDKHREFINEYVEVLGCELVHDPQENIFYLRGEGMPIEKLTLLNTKIILLMRLLYHEKMMGSNLAPTITNLVEIRQRGRDTNLLNRKLTTQEWTEALTIMKTHQIIELPGAVRSVEDTTPIYIYPTINVYLSGAEMEQLVEKFQDGKEEENSVEDERG